MLGMSISIRYLRKPNCEGLKRQLEGISWSLLEREGDVRSGSLGNEAGEGRSDQVFTRCGGRGVNEVRAEEAYKFFLHNLTAGQKQNIPYRAIRSHKNDPNWVTTTVYQIKAHHRTEKKHV